MIRFLALLCLLGIGIPAQADDMINGPCDPDFPDSDGDGSPNCEDQCPTDPAKVYPAVCGCNQTEIDTDGDSALATVVLTEP